MSPIIEFHVDAEEMAESYVMGRMPPYDAALFQVHLGRCPKCVARVEQTTAFIAAMRSAGRNLREGIPHSAAWTKPPIAKVRSNKDSPQGLEILLR